MDAVLLDTDVFSYLLKRNDARAVAYHRHIRGKTIALSFVTVGELYFWAAKRNWGDAKRAELETRLRSVIIVPFDFDICREYAKLGLLKTPEGGAWNIAANDRWIAACALRHSLPLVSNNRRHSDRIPGLVLISEASRVRGPKEQRLPLQGAEPT